MNISVIIPFYQRKHGLLKTALKSILDQTVKASITIVVVDDESPIPPENEIIDLPGKPNILIYKQKNGGPGAARNTGIGGVPLDTDYVAFIDSDDAWTNGHLERAVNALESTGATLFFEDILFENGKLLFNRLRVAETLLPFRLSKNATNTHFVSGGDAWFGLVLNGCVFTSSVVVRYSALKNLSFPLLQCGEDLIFWLNVGFLGHGFVFSNEIGAIYGSGVNIYSGSAWGDLYSLKQLNHEIKYRKGLCKDRRLPEKWRIEMNNRLKLARQNMAANLVHHFKRGRIIRPYEQIIEDPWLFFSLGYYFYKFFRR